MDDFPVTPIGHRPARPRSNAGPARERPDLPPDKSEMAPTTSPADHAPASPLPRQSPNRRPTQLASLGQGEREARARVHRAQRVGIDPAASSGRDGFGKQTKKYRLRSVLGVPEALAMTSHLARIFYRDASAEGTRGSERKHLSVGYGVMIDKLNALAGRPTQILGFAEPGERSGVLELARRLASSAGESA